MRWPFAPIIIVLALATVGWVAPCTGSCQNGHGTGQQMSQSYAIQEATANAFQDARRQCEADHGELSTSADWISLSCTTDAQITTCEVWLQAHCYHRDRPKTP